MSGYFQSAVRPLKTSLWTVRANAAFLSYQSQFHGFYYFRELLSFDASDIMFDMWRRWTWQDSVWKENNWTDFLLVCAGMFEPRLQGGELGSSGVYLTEETQLRSPGIIRFLGFIWSNICWEWTELLLHFSLFHRGGILWSLCFNSISLCFLIPLRTVPHPLFFSQHLEVIVVFLTPRSLHFQLEFMTFGSGSQEKTGFFQIRNQLCRRTSPENCWNEGRLHIHICLYILKALFSNRTLVLEKRKTTGCTYEENNF